MSFTSGFLSVFHIHFLLLLLSSKLGMVCLCFPQEMTISAMSPSCCLAPQVSRVKKRIAFHPLLPRAGLYSSASVQPPNLQLRAAIWFPLPFVVVKKPLTLHRSIATQGKNWCVLVSLSKKVCNSIVYGGRTGYYIFCGCLDF